MFNTSMEMLSSGSHNHPNNASLQKMVSNGNTKNNDGNYEAFDFGIDVTQLVEEPEFTDEPANAAGEAESAHVGTYPGSFVKYMDQTNSDSSRPPISKNNSSMQSVLQDSSWVFHLSDIFKNLSFNNAAAAAQTAKESDMSSAHPHDSQKIPRSASNGGASSTNEGDFAQTSSASKPHHDDMNNTSLKDVFMDAYAMNSEAMKPRPLAGGVATQPAWDRADAYQQHHPQQQQEQSRHPQRLPSSENGVPLLQPSDMTKTGHNFSITRKIQPTQRSTPICPADSAEAYPTVPQLPDMHAPYTLEQLQQEQLHQQQLWQERQQRHAELFAGAGNASVPDEQTVPNLHPSCTGSQYPLKRRLKNRSFNVMSTPQRKKASIWTKEEDERLRQAVKIFGSSNWKAIEQHVGTRSNQSCAQRWRKKLDPKIYGAKKGTWTTEEDMELQRMVQTHGTKGVRAWKAIEAGMSFQRTRKQCRERWTNFLDPNLNRGPWTEEEDRKLIYLASTGKNWKAIMKEMPGRTQTRLRRRLDKIKKSGR